MRGDPGAPCEKCCQKGQESDFLLIVLIFLAEDPFILDVFHPFLNVKNLTDNAEILSEKVLKIEKIIKKNKNTNFFIY